MESYQGVLRRNTLDILRHVAHVTALLLSWTIILVTRTAVSVVI